MAKQTINLGTSANDGTGDKLRTAFEKINENFDEVYDLSVIGAQGVQGTIGATGEQGLTGPIGSDGAQGVQGIQGAIGPQGVQGMAGAQGAIGAQGVQGIKGDTGSFGGAAFSFTYLTNTTNSDPGQGNLKFNNADLTLATEMYIDDLDSGSVDIQSFLRAIDESSSAIKGNFRISKTSNVDEYVFYAINDIVENTGYFTISCAHITDTISALTNSTSLVATFARTGDKGDAGPPGAQGSVGAQGVQGIIGVGVQGAVGAQGVQGAPGAGGGGSGAQGVQGAIGAQGVQGTAGTPGAVGAPGEGGYISYELLRNLSLATGTVTHNCDNGNTTVFVHSQIQANITANFTNVNLPANSAIGLTVIVNQGGTAYLPTAVQLNGQSQTLNWLDGLAPTGNPNKKDIVSYSIINQNGTTNTVFASLASFG
jgi:hypothetical protein